MLIFISGCCKKQESRKENKMESLPYYHISLKERYLLYQKENPHLTEEEIVTYVNIGLDQPYYTNTKKTPHINTPYILSNKYFYMEKNYVPNNLETIDFKYSSGNRMLVQEARLAFQKMAEDASLAGFSIRAISAYRSYQYQENLYQGYVNQDGKEKADTYSARPGFSEHQTGLVVDIDNFEIPYTRFEETKEFGWMMEHAADYGFILRYPKGKENITGYTYESWHYRYVGCEVAKKMQELKLTFDEYYARYIELEKE